MADRAPHLSPNTSSEEPEALEGEITRLRGELGQIAGELQQRWRDVTDIKLHVRRHAVGVATSVIVMGAVAAVSLAWRMRMARRRDTLPARAGRLREAVARIVDRPERVAVEPSAAQRIVAAAIAAVVPFVVKAALERLTGPGQRTGAVRPRWG